MIDLKIKYLKKSINKIERHIDKVREESYSYDDFLYFDMVNSILRKEIEELTLIINETTSTSYKT